MLLYVSDFNIPERRHFPEVCRKSQIIYNNYVNFQQIKNSTQTSGLFFLTIFISLNHSQFVTNRLVFYQYENSLFFIFQQVNFYSDFPIIVMPEIHLFFQISAILPDRISNQYCNQFQYYAVGI